MKTRTLALTSAAALAGALLFTAAPNLLARGGSGGGRGADGSAGDITGDGSGGNVGSTPGPAGNIGNGPGDVGNGPDGDAPRDGAEQEHIARDAVDGRARTDFRGLRDERNRRAAEPRRDGSR